MTMEIAIPLFLVAIAVLFMSGALLKRGKRWMLGGKILQTYEASPQVQRGPVKSRMKVHVVETRLPRAKRVGMEIRQATGIGLQLVPVSLSIDEAKELSEMLAKAAEFHQAREAEAKSESVNDESS